MKPYLCIIIATIFFTSACSSAGTSTPIPVYSSSTETPLDTDLPTDTVILPATPSPENTAVPTPGAEDWKNLPVVPEGVSESMKEVYQRGLAAGHDVDRFSKFGDCQNVPSLFLGTFDEGTYQLGEEYAYLQETIDFFSGSWNRVSVAVKGGMNVAAVQTLYYTDPEHCSTSESPMVCEIRVNNPSIVIISYETWWADKPTAGYEERLRAVVDYVLSQDVVPILATKADNYEGDNSINSAIARIAFDYQLPLWNFWAATYPLPLHGLSDGFHLTFAQNIFDDPFRMQSAWPWRNLTALQTIDAVYHALNETP
jgi:hypothetical protein